MRTRQIIYRDSKMFGLPMVERERNKLQNILNEIEKIKNKLEYHERITFYQYHQLFRRADELAGKILKYDKLGAQIYY